MKNRILSIDLLRGLGIMVIIVIHRLHYHWNGMRSSEVLHEHFSSAWAPLLITVIALFTMAGIFYFISGLVNAYSMYRAVEYKKIPVKKAVLGGVAGGIWIFILNYFHRLFFSNGFTLGENGADPKYPVGYLVGWIRNSNEVQFYPLQITEPGTLAVIGLVVIIVSLIMGVLLQEKTRNNKKRLFQILIFLSFFALLISPVLKYYFRPFCETNYQNGHYLSAFFAGHLCQEFSLAPYLGYGLMGALIGIALAMNEDFKIFTKRNRILMLILMVLGIVCMVFFDKEDSVGKWIIGSGITSFELGLFIVILLFLLRKIDFNPRRNESKTAFQFVTIRSFGMVALTVYFFEPLVAEIFITIIDRIVGGSDWHNQIQYVLLFGFFLLGIWTLILHFWKKVNFAGSMEWLSVKLLYVLAKKRSSKAEFNSIK